MKAIRNMKPTKCKIAWRLVTDMGNADRFIIHFNTFIYSNNKDHVI